MSDPLLAAFTGSPGYFPLANISPAIGAGDPAHCTAADQRGTSRPQPAGSNCDIGAIENSRGMPQPPSDTPTPTPTATDTPTATATDTPTPSETRR